MPLAYTRAGVKRRMIPAYGGTTDEGMRSSAASTAVPGVCISPLETRRRLRHTEPAQVGPHFCRLRLVAVGAGVEIGAQVEVREIPP